ncbi:MFS transporter [Actinoplanes sp. NPDC049118]|uniref:MFS transporter n=1 Tax=Actinoplanes sp. NPDC049118 TaxID=3155769 RepID=UPI0033EB8014
MSRSASPGAAQAASAVLITLAAGQFLMTLDSSVMNVAIATVAEDVGTTITGIQTAITLYTLVMAMLMVTGGKIGTMIGRRRAFAIGCVIYGLGSLITAIAPNLPILILGWSGLEGIGAALILPAIVALVAGNFVAKDRPRAYGLVMGAGAIAVAVGPLIGGIATTYFSWRWVFVGEVLVVAVILVLARRIADSPPEARTRFDVLGAILIAVGLGLAVFGVLRSSEWGWVTPKPDAPSWFGVSPTMWLILAGMLVTWIFLGWERRLEARGREPLVNPELFSYHQMTGGLLMFFVLYLVQAGLFFTIPLFLSVSLGLSALETGLRILPLSITLLAAAVGIPKYLPHASPRRVVRFGLLAMLLGILILLAAVDADADARIVTVPLLLAGLGIGALASQLGAVTVSAVPDEQSPAVGGLQNTATNLGAALGTALAGSVLIAALTTSFLTGVLGNPAIPDQAQTQASVQLASGVPYMSDAQLQAALTEAGVPPDVTAAAVTVNQDARVAGLRTALAVLALIAMLGLFTARRIPRDPVTGPAQPDDAAHTT